MEGVNSESRSSLSNARSEFSVLSTDTSHRDSRDRAPKSSDSKIKREMRHQTDNKPNIAPIVTPTLALDKPFASTPSKELKLSNSSITPKPSKNISSKILTWVLFSIYGGIILCLLFTLYKFYLL